MTLHQDKHVNLKEIFRNKTDTFQCPKMCFNKNQLLEKLEMDCYVLYVYPKKHKLCIHIHVNDTESREEGHLEESREKKMQFVQRKRGTLNSSLC